MSQGDINDYAKEYLQARAYVQDLANTVARKIAEGAEKAEYFSSACIYRVPKNLRKLKESAYIPRLIAIGPLHQKDKHLQTPLQHIKMSYTKSLLSRLTARMEDQLQECLAELKTLIDVIKKCYATKVTLNEEMMLVDGCFILEFLYRDHIKEVLDRDPIFCNDFTLINVKNDLVLLENQIPFLVLEKLFSLTIGKIPNRPNMNWSLSEYVWDCYRSLMRPKQKYNNSGSAKSTLFWPSDCLSENSSSSDCVLDEHQMLLSATAAEEEGQEKVQSGTPDINDHRSSSSSSSTAKDYHILHNLHGHLLPDHDQTEQKVFDYKDMPSASELVYAGVKFVPDALGNNLFNFNFIEHQGLFWWFRRAHFKIPRLTLEDQTESYFRNLIALEQCCPDVPGVISTYALVMDTLVSTEKDIEELEKAGVLRNWLGASEDATNLFNNLCKEIVLDDKNFFSDTCENATKYSKRFWPRNMAHVRRTYLASPWTFAAFCVGFIVFVITCVEFIRDVL